MTDKTDTPELRRFNFEIWPHEAYISEAYDGEYVLFADAHQQIEAERHKGDLWFGKVADLEAALKTERQRADDALTSITDYLSAPFKVKTEIAALKGEQVSVISKEKLCDWLEDNFDIDDSQRDAFAACFAHCCDCIVQSHSPAPVGEIVAWAGTDREKGITREVDFRFLRFDVLPGTKLYAVEPEPAAKSDLLTRAQALAVETRALACRIKAGD